MRTPALVRMAVCAAMMTLSVHAAPAGKRFGGFAPKQTFSFKVADRQAFESKGARTVQTFSIPTGIPKFNVGQTVKLTIGAKGQLTGPGFSLPLEAGNSTYNHYLTVRTVRNPVPDTALLTKKSSRAARQVALYFYDKKSGKAHSVSYVLR